MTRAELGNTPADKDYKPSGIISEEYPEKVKVAYLQGYEQAEKDLALTWEDMQLIWQILDMMSEECKRSNPEWAYGSKSYFIEVLKRFKEAKK